MSNAPEPLVIKDEDYTVKPAKQKLAYEGKVCIATPFYNMQAYSPYVLSLLQTTQVLEKVGVEFQYISCNDSYVDRARNTLAAMFLSTDCTDLFFIDSDESWDTWGFFRLMMSPVEVIGASYLMKNNWGVHTASLEIQDGHPKGKLIKENVAILEAISIPCGFMRIKRSALEKYRDAYPELHYNMQGQDYTDYFTCSRNNGDFTGEDVTFCQRWRALGGKVWVEPNVEITHYGMNGWTANLDKDLREGLLRQKKEQQEKEAA